eukprot:TRINITY_DN2363_c0_g2_i1.p1 TRINITY_DN2363_c0_g2~~TRINITY_DN2363_c0_g2_i1.p1  ORF type:complete len:1015 (-),score=186.29 TRINITY_DN2363_c0_g2_i1:244-2835(-)
MADPNEKLFLQWRRSPSPRGVVLPETRVPSPVGKIVQEQASLNKGFERDRTWMKNSATEIEVAQRHLRKVIRNAVHQCSTIQALDASLATVRQPGGLHVPKEGAELSKVLHGALRGVKKENQKQCAHLLMQILTQEAQHHRFALVSEQGSSDARLQRFLQKSSAKVEVVQQTKHPKEQDAVQLLESSDKGETCSLKQALGEQNEAHFQKGAASSKLWSEAFNQVARSGRLQKQRLPRAVVMAGFGVSVRSWIDEICKDLSATGLSVMTQGQYLDFIRLYSARTGDAQKKIFERIDTDKSGTISARELGTVLEHLGIEAKPSLVNEVLQKVDVDGTGDLNFQEFETLLSLLQGNFGFTGREKQELLTAFGRFDMSKTGQIPLDSIGRVFRWLGYILSPQEVKCIAEECDKDGSEGIDFREFMAAVAQARQIQLTKVKELAQEQDLDNSGTLSLAELESALKALGYNPERRVIDEVKEALTSDPAFKNHLRQLDLRVEDLADFFEFYRTREGLTSEECSELHSAFARYDYDGLGRVRTLDADKVLRWYGLSLDSQECAGFVAKVDVDRSGYLSEHDFRKILRLESEAATLTFEEKFRKMDYSGGGTIRAMQAERLFQELDLDLDPSSLHANDMIVYTSLWHVSGDLPMAAFVRTCAKRKKFIMANWRQYGNFGDVEIQALKEQFDQFVEEPYGDEKDAPGEIAVAAFFQFLDGFLPTPINDPGLHERFVELKKELESSNCQTLSFREFLRIYRQFHDLKAELAQLKHAKAVQASGFLQTEIEEFRHLFQEHANEDYLEPSALRRLVGTVLPLSEQKNMAALAAALKEIQRNRHPSFGGGVDFPEFLMVMKKIEGLNPRKKTDMQQ